MRTNKLDSVSSYTENGKDVRQINIRTADDRLVAVRLTAQDLSILLSLMRDRLEVK